MGLSTDSDATKTVGSVWQEAEARGVETRKTMRGLIYPLNSLLSLRSNSLSFSQHAPVKQTNEGAASISIRISLCDIGSLSYVAARLQCALQSQKNRL